MGYIYKITNNINNKVYIGQTRNSVNRRWTEHKRDSKKSNNDFVLYRAMRKYGFDNFMVETIESDVPLDKLNEREVYWIKYYDSFNSEKGYNLTSGGGQNMKISDSTKEKHRRNALMGITGHKHLPVEEVYTKEVRERISKGNKGKKSSEESKRKISDSMKGKKCSQKSIDLLIERNKKRIWTKEQRKKISDKMKNHLSDKRNHNFYHKYGEESPYHICVLQYDNNKKFIKKFNSKKEVLEYLQLKGHDGLNKAIKNKLLYKGYYWSIEGVETNEIASFEEKKVV